MKDTQDFLLNQRLEQIDEMETIKKEFLEFELEDLRRTLHAEKWLYSVWNTHGLGDDGRPAWSWTANTMALARIETIRKITAQGGLLLIGGVYLELDRA